MSLPHGTHTVTENHAGYSFHLDNATLQLSLAHKSFGDFSLGVEVSEAGKFDDLIFCFKNNKGELEGHFIQFKNFAEKNICFYDLFKTNGKLCLADFFESYMKIESDKVFFNDLSNKKYFIFTNTLLNTDDFSSKLPKVSFKLVPKTEQSESNLITERRGECFQIDITEEIIEKINAELENIKKKKEGKKNKIPEQIEKCEVNIKNFNTESQSNADKEREKIEAYRKEIIQLGKEISYIDKTNDLNEKIKIFLEKLYFCVDQPEKNKIDSEIEETLKIKLNVEDAKFHSNILGSLLLKYVRDGSTKNDFITKARVDEYVIKNPYLNKELRKFNEMIKLLEFDENKLQALLSLESNITIIEMSKNLTMFGAAMVYQHKKISNSFDDSFMFINSETLDEYKEVFSHCFSKNLKYLVIDYKNYNVNDEAINKFKMLTGENDEIQARTDRFVIIICEKNDKNESSELKKKYIMDTPSKSKTSTEGSHESLCETLTTTSHESLFKMLTEDSQKELLNIHVKFQYNEHQGIKEVEMLDILNEKDFADLINNNFLLKRVNGEEISFGSDFFGKSFDKNLYIERNLILKALKQSEVSEGKISTEHIEIDQEKIVNKQEKPLGSDLLEKPSDKDLSGEQSIENSKKELVEEIEIGQGKIILIQGVSGMGKSTELINIGIQLKKKYPNYYILRIELGKSKCIDNIVNFENDPMKFMKCFINDKFNEDLFEKLFNLGHAVILFDAFDEIPVKVYTETVEMLKKLILLTSPENIKNQLIFTSRFNCSKLLTNEPTIVYELNILKETQIKNLLVNYWKKSRSNNKENEKLEEFANDLYSKLNNISKLEEFLGNPLHTMMLAEIYEDKLTGNKDFELSEICISDLFNMYFRKKIIVASRKDPKGSDFICDDVMRVFNIIESHLNIAFYNFSFSEETLFFFDKYAKNDLTNDVLQTIGLVYIENKKKYFLHQAFPEYLVGKFVSNKIIEISSKKILKNSDKKFLNVIFQEFMVKDDGNNNHTNSMIIEFIDEILEIENIIFSEEINSVFYKIFREKINWGIFIEIVCFTVRKNSKLADIVYECLKQAVREYDFLEDGAQKVMNDFFKDVQNYDSIQFIVPSSASNDSSGIIGWCEQKINAATFKEIVVKHYGVYRNLRQVPNKTKADDT